MFRYVDLLEGQQTRLVQALAKVYRLSQACEDQDRHPSTRTEQAIPSVHQMLAWADTLAEDHIAAPFVQDQGEEVELSLSSGERHSEPSTTGSGDNTFFDARALALDPTWQAFLNVLSDDDLNQVQQFPSVIQARNAMTEKVSVPEAVTGYFCDAVVNCDQYAMAATHHRPPAGLVAPNLSDMLTRKRTSEPSSLYHART